jgi:hypothetical protein
MQFLEDTIDVVAGVQERIRGGEGAGWPTMSDTLGVALRDHFAVNPEDREVWTSTAPVTGDGRPTITTLLLRLRRTRDVLAGGVRYRCLDRPPCPPMSRPDEVVLGAIAFTDPDVRTNIT